MFTSGLGGLADGVQQQHHRGVGVVLRALLYRVEPAAPVLVDREGQVVLVFVLLLVPLVIVLGVFVVLCV